MADVPTPPPHTGPFDPQRVQILRDVLKEQRFGIWTRLVQVCGALAIVIGVALVFIIPSQARGLSITLVWTIVFLLTAMLVFAVLAVRAVAKAVASRLENLP